jgi:predicted enzyme related to lactoylglutathione lyase
MPTARHVRLSSLTRLGAVAAALAAIALPAIAPPAAAAPPPPPLPALVTPPSDAHHVGKLVFTELVTPDLDAAKTFYGKLFGWTFQDIALGSGKYAEAESGGHPVGGIFQRDIPPGEHRQPAWLTFLSVRDVDAAGSLAVQHGAKLLFAPHDIPGLGREAVLADPQGAVFAMLASASGDPPDEPPALDAWIWSSLITGDPDTAAAFYQAVFGYEVYDMPAKAEAQHFILANENFARASVNPMPDRPGAHPAWIDYVRVENASRATAQVVALGGRVLVPPFVDRHGGHTAVVADPQGAPFGLLEWSDDAGAGAAK